MNFAVVMYSDLDNVGVTKKVEADDSTQAVERAVKLVEAEGYYDREVIVVVDILDDKLNSHVDVHTTTYACDWPGLEGGGE